MPIFTPSSSVIEDGVVGKNISFTRFSFMRSKSELLM